MTRFHSGQQVVCVVKRWFNLLGIVDCKAPMYNEVVTVSYYLNGNFSNYLILKEYGEDNFFLETGFEPLITDKQLEEELSSVKEVSYA